MVENHGLIDHENKNPFTILFDLIRYLDAFRPVLASEDSDNLLYCSCIRPMFLSSCEVKWSISQSVSQES